jgi:hypothetical protein
MVIDIGGGTTEVGVISLGGMVYKGSVRVGGDKFDDAIINYIRRNYGMLIGEPTAEAIKKNIGSAFPGSEVREMEVKGRNLSEGVPRSFTISSNEILEALTDPLNNIVSAVKTALEHTPPELGADETLASPDRSMGLALPETTNTLPPVPSRAFPPASVAAPPTEYSPKFSPPATSAAPPTPPPPALEPATIAAEPPW